MRKRLTRDETIRMAERNGWRSLPLQKAAKLTKRPVRDIRTQAIALGMNLRSGRIDLIDYGDRLAAWIRKRHEELNKGQ